MHRISSQFNNTDTQYQLRKQEVRQAIAHLLDREEFVKTVEDRTA